jgi:hypothetical protein
MKMLYLSTLWITAAILCLLMSGCMFRQANIDGHEDHLLSYDRSDVDSTQKVYRDSVLANGQYSSESEKAGSDMKDAQHKLDIDQRDYDQYRSASGQSAVSLQ